MIWTSAGMSQLQELLKMAQEVSRVDLRLEPTNAGVTMTLDLHPQCRGGTPRVATANISVAHKVLDETRFVDAVVAEAFEVLLREMRAFLEREQPRRLHSV